MSQANHVPHERMRRLLGKLSAGRQFDPMSSAPGGVAQLTWADIAAAVARLRINPGVKTVRDELTQSLLLYHWAGAEAERPKAAHWLAEELHARSERERWRWRARKARQRTRWLEGMASLALIEIVRRRPCGECGATGREWRAGTWETLSAVDAGGVIRLRREWKPGRHEPCGACRGLGAHPWSARERAIKMGVAPSTWQTWDPRYVGLLDLIEKIERRGLGKLRRVLG